MFCRLFYSRRLEKSHPLFQHFSIQHQKLFEPIFFLYVKRQQREGRSALYSWEDCSIAIELCEESILFLLIINKWHEIKAPIAL